MGGSPVLTTFPLDSQLKYAAKPETTAVQLLCQIFPPDAPKVCIK